MHLERPDLSQVDPTVLAYIEALEAENERLRASERDTEAETAPESAELDIPLEPNEPATTLNLITISGSGLAKRTPRHLYSRQRRGGMGIFDLETNEADPPAFLVIADESQTLILFTNRARAFRLPVSDLPESPVHSRGQSLTDSLGLLPNERLAAVLPDQSGGSVAFLTERGYVRCLPAHLFGEKMNPEMAAYKFEELGPLVAARWTSGNSDLFIATRRGLAIRFPEKQVPLPGGLGIRLDGDDAPVALAAVRPENGVFLLSADGRGTIRLMSGFNANKAPGGGGKVAMKTDQLIGAVTMDEADDIFIISRLSKIIRFQAAEVPAKEGVVQGVNCMALRADETVAVARSFAVQQA